MRRAARVYSYTMRTADRARSDACFTRTSGRFTSRLDVFDERAPNVPDIHKPEAGEEETLADSYASEI
jgi:hypothetical protein